MNAPRHSRKLILAVATVGALLALSGGFAAFRADASNAKGPGQPQAMPVSVATVVQQDVATWDEFSGRLEAVDRVDVRSRVAEIVEGAWPSYDSGA